MFDWQPTVQLLTEFSGLGSKPQALYLFLSLKMTVLFGCLLLSGKNIRSAQFFPLHILKDLSLSNLHGKNKQKSWNLNFLVIIYEFPIKSPLKIELMGLGLSVLKLIVLSVVKQRIGHSLDTSKPHARGTPPRDILDVCGILLRRNISNAFLDTSKSAHFRILVTIRNRTTLSRPLKERKYPS